MDDAFHYLQDRSLKGNHQTVVSDRHSDHDSGFNSASEDNNDPSSTGHRLYVFSSSDQAGLQRMSSAFADHLDEKIDSDKKSESIRSPSFTSDLAYTLGSRRSVLDHRGFVVAKSASDLSKQLRKGFPKLRRTAKNNDIIFVFTGQGAQWPTMGKELMSQKAYMASLERSQVALDALGCPWSLIDKLSATKDASRVGQPDLSQPLCTALQLALIDLLATWGVTPKAVIGHSSGEIGE